MRQTENGLSPAATAVLFIHGFLGSPRQFSYLLPVARACGCDAYALTLPGHGGTLGEFTRTGKSQWEAYVRQELDTLRNRYDSILLVGHSMGCLLAVREAIRNPNRIIGILALALPLYMRVSIKGMKINFQYMTQHVQRADARMQAAREFCGVGGVFLWNAVAILPKTLDVLSLSAKTRRSITGMPVPLVIMHSPGDEWVSRRTLKFVNARLKNAHLVQLSESGHFWYADVDRETIKNELARMLGESNQVSR